VRAVIKIQAYIRGWIYRRRVKNELRLMLKDQGMEELLFTQPEYRRFKANRLLVRAVRILVKNLRLRKLH
jgi:hypothetical protein